MTTALQQHTKDATWAAICANPSTLSQLCERLAAGETLKDIARAWDVPVSWLLGWVYGDPERRTRIEAALELWAHTLVQECVAIADREDPTAVKRDALRVDTRLKVAGLLVPRTYGRGAEAQTERPRRIILAEAKEGGPDGYYSFPASDRAGRQHADGTTSPAELRGGGDEAALVGERRDDVSRAGAPDRDDRER